MLRSSASLTASAAKAELNVTLLPDMLTRALYARQLHGIHGCRKQLALYRKPRRGRGCTRQSSHPGTAKSQRYQGIESRGKEAVAGSEEEKEAEEVGITLSG
jgi:hypothetical protein